MTTLGTPAASADITVDASPEAVYGLITDLATLAELAEETTAMSWHKGDAARPGAKFKGRNRNGRHTWTTTCTVTEADPGRGFAFDVHSAVVPIAHWRYDITPAGDGCRVTESTWDHRPGWMRRIAHLLTGVRDRGAANHEHIRATLARLKERAERG